MHDLRLGDQMPLMAKGIKHCEAHAEAIKDWHGVVVVVAVVVVIVVVVVVTFSSQVLFSITRDGHCNRGTTLDRGRGGSPTKLMSGGVAELCTYAWPVS